MKTKQTFKKRLVSGLLALTMVLGFLPANLFPAASALNTEIAGGGGWCINGNNAGSLRLNIDQTGSYTLTFTPTITAGNVRLNYAIIPTFNPGRTSIKSVIGTSKFNSDNVNYMMVENSSRVYSPSASISAYGGINADLTAGTPVTVASGTLAGGNLWTTLEGSYNSSRENDGYEYIVVFNTSNASRLQWAYTTVYSQRPAHIPDQTVRLETMDRVNYFNVENDGGELATIQEVNVIYDTTVGLETVNSTDSIAAGSSGVWNIRATVDDLEADATAGVKVLDVVYTTGSDTGERNPIHATITVIIGSAYDVRGNEITFVVTEGESGNKTQNASFIARYIDDSGNWTVISTVQIFPDDPDLPWTWICNNDDDDNYGLIFNENTSVMTLPIPNSKLTSTGGPNGDGHYPLTLMAPATDTANTDLEGAPFGYVAIPITIIVYEGEAPTEYTVKFDTQGGTPTPADQTVAEGDLLTKPTDPTHGTDVFNGWYTEATGGDKWDFDSNTVSGNMTLYAHWTQKYAVTFDANKPSTAATGNNVSGMPSDSTGSTDSVDDDNPQYVVSGNKPELPQQPTLNGYKFLGWDTNKGSTSPSWKDAETAPTINNDVIYYAIWEVEPVTFEDVVFSGKQGTTPVIDGTSGGLGYATAGGHNKTDFTYEFLDSAGNSQGTSSYTMNGVTYSFDTTGQLVASDNLAEAKPGTFKIKATSTLNGKSATATVTLQVPPRVNSGSMKENSLLPGKTVNTKELGLTDGTKIPTDVNWGGITKAQWYWGIGGTMVGITNTSEQGPTMKTEISGATDVESVEIPADAFTGSHLWLKVTGDGTNVDGGVVQTGSIDNEEAIWVDMGEIGKDRRSILVVPSVWTTSGTKVSTTPADIKANAVPSQLGADESGQLNTISTSTEYVFVGWSTNDSNTGYTTAGGSLTGPNGNWTVVTESPYLSSGRNSATFNMKTLPESEDPIKIYAIYKQVETKTITVVMQPGVASVQYAIGSTTKTESNSGTTAKTFTIKVKTTDSVTFIASPGANSICSGYTFDPNSPGTSYAIITGDDKSTVSLTAKQDFTITFNAKSVSDLHIDGEQHYASEVEGYNTLASKPIFTATLTNPGAANATIDTANSGLYADSNGVIGNKVDSSYDTFTFTDVPETVDANTASNSTKYQVKVTPKDGLDPGTYTVWLQITESTAPGDTKTGTALVYRQKITFVVKEDTTFTGKVKVSLDGTVQNGESVTLQAGSEAAIGTTYQSTGTDAGYYTSNSKLDGKKTYKVLVNNTDTGYVLHAADPSQTINFYTLTTSVTPAGIDKTSTTTDIAVTVPATPSTGKKVTVAGKTGYTEGSVLTLSVPATGVLSSQAYVFDKWTVATGAGSAADSGTTTNLTVTMSNKKTVVAAYAASLSLIYDYGYTPTGASNSVFYTDAGHKAGDKVALTSLTPTRTGYTFKHWGASANATTAVTSPVTLGDDNTTVYAVWERVEPSWATLASGEYGKEYLGSVAITSGNTGTVKYAIGNDFNSVTGSTSASGLAALGLELNEDTGALSGKPRGAGTYTFTVKATNGDGETWTKKYTLIIAKATPVVTGVNFTSTTGSIDDGMAVGNLRLSATVTAPYWDSTIGDNGDWVDSKSYTYTDYDLGAAGTNPGKITMSSPTGTNLDFKGSTSIQATLAFTPEAPYATIYNATTGTGYINLGSKVYSFTAEDNPTIFTSQDSTGSQPAAKTVTITNTGNQTGYFSFTLEDLEGNEYSANEFTVGTLSKATLGTTTDNKTATLTVQPTAASCAVVGTHNVVIHIVEYDKAEGEEGRTVKAEERVLVTFVVTAGKFTGTVDTKLHAVSGTTTSAVLPTGNVVLTNIAKSSDTVTAIYNSTDKKYKAAELTVGETYSVEVNGTLVPGVYVTYEGKDAVVDLYEVTLAKSPVGVSGTLTGAGYYLEGQAVTVTAPASGTVGSTGYSFKDWEKDSTQQSIAPSYTFTMGNAAAALTAVYEESAGTLSVIYSAGAGITGVIVPTDTTKYSSGSSVTVSTMKPVRPGYTFTGWTGDNSVGNKNPGETFIMPAASVTLTAQWEQAETTWTSSLPEGVYGDSYYGSVSMDTSATGSVKYSATNLPGGLEMAENGTITGKPYEVGTKTVTVTATSATDNSLKWTTMVDLTVGKATPTMTVTSATGAVVGQAYNTATYVVEVVVPKLTTRGDDTQPDAWGTATYKYTLPTAGTGDAAATTGSVAVATGNFAAGSNSVELAWTAGSGSTADANNNVYKNIYKDSTVNAVLGANASYGIKTEPIANTWIVKEGYTVAATGTDGSVNTTTNTATPLQVTITNLGDQATGDLTLALTGGVNSDFEISSGTVVSIAKDGTATFTVKPKVKTEGVYTDTVTVTGSNGISSKVKLTLVVNQSATFDFEVDTYLHTAADTNEDGTLGNVTSIALRNGGTDTPGTRTADGKYTWTGLDSSKSYSVVVNGYVTTNVVTYSTAKPMKVHLYRATLAQDPAATGATLELEGVTGTSAYYVEGQSFKASTDEPNLKKLVQWDETKHQWSETDNKYMDATTPKISTSLALSYVMPKCPVTLTAKFEDVVEYEVKLVDPMTGSIGYATGENYRNILTGGTDTGSIYKVSAGATFGLPQPVTTVVSGQYSMTQSGYTFRGWATSDSETTGSFVFTADEAADEGDGNVDNIIILYPVWTKDSDLKLPGGVVEGVYKHPLTGQQVTAATGGSGDPAYGYDDSVTTKPFDIALGSDGTFSGKPDDVGSKTVKVKVTANDDTATADYSFVISKADMTPDGTNGLPTDVKVEVTSTDIEQDILDSLKNTVMNGDGTGEDDIPGSWSLPADWTAPTTPGTYTVTVTYTAENTDDDKDGTVEGQEKYGEHYNSYTTTISYTVNPKLITGADIKVDVPATNGTPNNLAMVQGRDNALTSSDSKATYTTDVEITNVVWSPAPSGNKFAANTAYTVTVYLKIKDGSKYRFDTNTTKPFNGTINDATATEQLSLTAETASFSLEFAAEPTKLTGIDVTVGTLGVGSTTTNVTSGEPAKYTVTAYKWVPQGDTDAVTGDGFEDGSKYDVLVTVKPQDGYVFDPAVFGGVKGTELKDTQKWNATVNTESDLTKGKKATVETKLNADGTIEIRYSYFEPVAEEMVAISDVSGSLGIYYAQMSETSGTKHKDDQATGHKSGVPFTFDPSKITVNATYKNAATNKTSIKAVTTGRTFYVIDPGNSNNEIVLYKDGETPRTFRDYDSYSDLELDGLMVYVKISGLPAATQVDRLVVKELEVMSIAAAKDKDLPKPTLEYNAGANFAPGTMKSTEGVTVTFNSDTSDLTNSVGLTGYGAKDLDENQPKNYFYALDAAGKSELTASTPLNVTDHNGKTVYLCYADVNDHVVSVAVGTLKIKSTGITVTVEDENGHDPEYGDKLTATPTGGTGPYTYQWQEKDGDNWKDITGATSPTYTPDKGRVGDTIRVVVTDSTGGEGTGDKIGDKDIVVEKRSVNFTVEAFDKTEDGDKNNEHSYEAKDFTLTAVGTYGGVILGDKVTLAPDGTWNNDETTRPAYSDKTAGSKITWPEIEVNDGTGVGQTGGYAFGDTDKDCYRLAAQDAQANRGTIKAKGTTTVSHVDVSFKEIPTFNHDIPGSPMGVTDTRETLPGETGASTFTATWYTGFTDLNNRGTVANGKFGADTYTVVVKVKPNTSSNYVYNLDSNDGIQTRFNFHFGDSQWVDVTDKVTEADGVYTMYYTFSAVERVKVAHVNVSVPQPVVENSPANGSVNQALGTDSSDQKNNVVMSNITWCDAATGGKVITSSDEFQAGGVYRAEFDLTTTNGYQYVNGTATTDKVKFIVSGVGPITGEDTEGNAAAPANTVIESVTTSALTDNGYSADNGYHVVVVYKAIVGGKADLTDVVVDASPATAADIEKTGPEVAAEKKTIYDLTDSNNKWQYWNGTTWADASNGTGLSADGKFQAGYDYRVTAKVELKDTAHYQFGTDTKFYLAGQECTTSKAPAYHPVDGNEKTLTKNSDTTYTLIQEFRVPANEISMVTVTYDLPLNSGTSIPSAPEYYGDQDMVNIANNATSWVKLGTTDTYKNDFTSAGSTPGTTFEESQYYRVTSVMTPETGYKFTNSTVVVINGVPVTVDGAEGEVKENGTTVAYVKAVTDGNNIKAMLIAKVRSTAIDPIELKHADITPVAESAPSSALFELAKASEARYAVDTTVHNGGKGTWEYEDTPGHWTAATNGSGLDASGNFLSGTKYRVTVGVKATGTNVFAAGASGTVDNTANSTKKNATVQVATDRKTATLTVTFDPTNIKTASMVDVYFRRQPEVGKNPATLQEDGNWVYKFPAAVNNAPTETVGTLTGTGMEQFDVKWYDTTGTTFDPSASNTPMTGNFVANKSYTVTVRVKPAAGWQYILDTDPNTEDTKFTIFASDAGHTSSNVWYDTAKGDYVMWYTFAPTEDPSVIVRVAANVAQPVANVTMSTDVSKILAQNKDNDDMLAHVTMSDVAWTVSSTSNGSYTDAAGNTFEANKYYRATFTVAADTGYSFLADTNDKVDFLINGIFDNTKWIDGEGYATAADGTKVTITGSGNKYTVQVDFPVTGSTADVLTVWGDVKAPAKADSNLANYPIKVADEEPYQIVTGTNKWYTDSSCATPATKFEAGETYYAKLTVKIKDGMNGYQFTADTAGYINDTTPGATTKTFNAADGTITLVRAFPIPKDKVIVLVNSDAPAAGAPLPTDITEGDATKYEFTSAAWSGDLDGGNVQKGKTYTLTVTVKPKEGVELYEDTTGYKWNGSDAKSFKKNSDGSYTVTFTHIIPPDGAQPVDEVPANASRPIANKQLDPKGWTSADFDVQGNVTWYKGSDTTGSPVSGTADYSTVYTAEVKVKLKDGKLISDHPTYKFNGEVPTSHSGPDANGVYTLTYTFRKTEAKPETPPPQVIPGGTTTVTEELPVVTYWISDNGFTNDLTAEKMARAGAKPTFVPKVSGKEGYTFKGWSEVDPTTLASGAEIKLVDPLTFSITKDKTFYAVYDEPRFEHDHYASGYPDGTFKPEQYITRAEVAAIVANSCLDGFDNTANYGNPGNYSDINPNKWYGNDVAYCTMYGVFNGYKDGTFKPDQYITRQELAVVVANMAGMQTNQGLPFTDANSVSKWARNGVYTVYENNWVSGYPDGTFRPQNNITRAETVAIFNGYLHRGVDAKGLSDLTSYMLDASSGGYQGDGMTQYMTWIDVPEKYWAYYHILEATNDHDFHWPDEEKMPPEHWDAAYQDETWRYRQEFAVTYVVGDHGTAASDAVLTISVKEGGMPKTVPAVTADSGWTFKGWAETPNGAVVDPRTVTIKEAKTFYGVYEAVKPTFTVRYDAGANGALTAASSETVVQGSQPAHVPGVNAREGWTFKGWSETANGALVTPSAVTISADKTFYAVYAAVEPEQPELQTHKAYMSGYDDGTFRPSQAITRADVVTMVVRALGTDYDPNKTYDTSSVTDVADHPAQNMIGYCIEKGIFSGYKDGTFLPEGTMTRQEFAVVIANLAGGAQENQGLPFTDADSVNKWARNAVYTVYVNGWIGGYKDGSFQPKNNITRAEAAVIFNGFLGRSVDKTSLTDVSAGAASPWSDVKATNWAYQNIMEATTDHSYYTENGVEHWAEP